MSNPIRRASTATTGSANSAWTAPRTPPRRCRREDHRGPDRRHRVRDGESARDAVGRAGAGRRAGRHVDPADRGRTARVAARDVADRDLARSGRAGVCCRTIRTRRLRSTRWREARSPATTSRSSRRTRRSPAGIGSGSRSRPRTPRTSCPPCPHWRSCSAASTACGQPDAGLGRRDAAGPRPLTPAPLRAPCLPRTGTRVRRPRPPRGKAVPGSARVAACPGPR